MSPISSIFSKIHRRTVRFALNETVDFSPWLWKCHSCPTPRICMEDVIPIPLAKHIETYSMYYYRTTVDRNETVKYVRALRYISLECGIWRSCTFLPILNPKNPRSNDLPSWIAIIAAVLESCWGQDIQGWFHLGWAPSSLSWRWVLVISWTTCSSNGKSFPICQVDITVTSGTCCQVVERPFIEKIRGLNKSCISCWFVYSFLMFQQPQFIEYHAICIYQHLGKKKNKKTQHPDQETIQRNGSTRNRCLSRTKTKTLLTLDVRFSGRVQSWWD